MKIVREFPTGGPISAASTVADLHGDGGRTIITPADGLYAWDYQDGRLLPGFPVFGGNFFASQPLAADLFGDGRMAIIAGCDDDCLYAFDSAGRLLSGFPIRTGGDIYSSPAAADLDGDGCLEIVAGSDDGRVYAWRADGTALPGWPQQTEGFVASTPVLADLDNDGCLEIICASWDGRVYAWRAGGEGLTGWPQQTGHFVWSTPLVADLNGDGCLNVIAVSDWAYAWHADGTALSGWPQELNSYAVARPLVIDWDGDGCQELIVAADGLYAWDAQGRRLPGFPKDWGTFFWSSPLPLSSQPQTLEEIAVCGWDGHLYQLRSDGRILAGQLSRSPLFATPTLLEDGGRHLLLGTWDSRLLLVQLETASQLPLKKPARLAIRRAGSLTRVKAGQAPFVSFPGPPDPQGRMFYRAGFESEWHPVPLVWHDGSLTGLFQPFPAGTTVSFYAQANGRRLPDSGFYRYRVVNDWPGRLRRRIRRRTAARGA